MKSLTLFNNKGGVGKTTMTFNLAHMIARLGRRVVIVDCDPQCNLSALALSEDELTTAFEAPAAEGRTVGACVELVRLGKGDLHEPRLHELADDNLGILPGDLSLGRFEGKLANEWPSLNSADAAESSLHVVTAIERLAARLGDDHGAEVIFFDVWPSFGALNRAVLLACDAVVIPLAPDLFSLRGLESIGETMDEWREGWARARSHILQDRAHRRDATAALPEHAMKPIGYVIQQHLARDEVPLRAHARWAERIPEHYERWVLGRTSGTAAQSPGADPNCLSHLRHFASLVPLAQAARKPIFDLKHADGVLGTQFQLVERARVEFTTLAQKILARLDAA
jgi:chromosome partitioning protein